MKSSSGGFIAKLIGYVLVVLLLVGSVGLVYKFTNGFNEDFKTFYIEYDGEEILTQSCNMVLESNKEHRFNVKYTFDNNKSQVKDYSVKIIPNTADDVAFDFTVEGETYSFGAISDLTDGFELTKYETYFTLNIPSKFSVATVLEKVYDGKTVYVPQSGDITNPYLYTLVVSSYNGNVTYYIHFYCTTEATKVTINPPSIVFGGAEQPRTALLNPSISSEFFIEYLTDGDATNLVDITINGPEKATVGDKVWFTVTLYDKDYTITDMRISVMNSTEDVKITDTNGAYSFIMPQGNTYVWITLQYSPSVPEITQYSIEYDTLGSGSVLSINMNCPAHAAEGDRVTFTISLKDLSDEYDDYTPLEITNIVLQDSDGEDHEIGSGEGTFSFTMPEGNVTIMVYLMPAD
jgi:hypothetical protein